MIEEQNKIKFFVVEDHTLTNRGIRELIGERSRFTCVGFAFSKTECLEKLSGLAEEAKLPDIIILDLFFWVKKAGLIFCAR